MADFVLTLPLKTEKWQEEYGIALKMQKGLKQKDASHIACAIFAKADYFLTTDKKILNKPIKGIEVMNPIEFVRRYLDE